MHRVGWVGIIAGAMLVTGLYILLLTFAPVINLPIVGLGQPDVTAIMRAAASDKNWLYIPQINLSMPITTGDISVLDHNIWHRQPHHGDPRIGGNFVLSGHRFYMGLTPMQTRERSPLYNIDKLKVGDEFFVDFSGERYAYRVSRLYSVPPTAVEIEAPSDIAKLTLYSCDLRGAAAGRYVVEALPYN